MDRKTLLGLVTGAAMLGLVLFFVGMLVGAGLFMEPEDRKMAAGENKGPAEILATLPDSHPAPDRVPMADQAMPAPASPGASASDTAADAAGDDPVGDLIAQRSQGAAPSAPEISGNDSVNAEETPVEDVRSVPQAPAIDENLTDAQKAAARAQGGDNAPRKLQAPEIRTQDSAAAAPSAPSASATTQATTSASTTNEPAKPAAATKPAARASASTGGSKPFSIQIGAFKVHENASQRAEELRKQGHEANVVARGPEGDATWYYVRVGKYATQAEARDSAKSKNLDGFAVRAEPNDREVN